MREVDDDQDEGEADEEQPDERQVAAENGRHVVDGHRADDGPDQRSAPAERRPDHQLGAEHEVAVRVGRHAAEQHVAAAGQRGDGAADGHDADLQPRRSQAQVAAPLLVFPNGDEDATGVARDEHVGDRRDEEQESAGDPVPLHDRERGNRNRQTTARPGVGATAENDLREDDRQRQRDDRDVDGRRLVEEGQPAHGGADERRRHHRAEHGGGRAHAVLDVVGQGNGHRVDTDAEERRLPERQDARVAPQDVDRDGGDREEERLRQDLLGVLAEHERAGREQHEHHDDDAGGGSHRSRGV